METRQVDPAKTDPLMTFFIGTLKWNPVLLAVAYTMVSLIGTILLAWVHGTARATPGSSRLALFDDRATLFNLGILTPVGVWLIANFYERTRDGFDFAIREASRFGNEPIAVGSADKAINPGWPFKWGWPFWASLALTILANGWIVSHPEGTWRDLDAGLPAWWLRAIMLINYFMIFHVLLKGVLVVIAMHRMKVDVRPLHPDGFGGLAPLREICIALNYFVALVAAFLSVLYLFEGTPTSMPFVVLYGGFLLLAFLLVFGPLLGAHAPMAKAKKEMLTKLTNRFTQIANETPEDVDAMIKLKEPYQMVSAMPVWPFDVKIIAQAVGTVVIPFAMHVVKQALQERVHLPW